MSRFCKTCRFLEADKAQLKANCMFWVQFAEKFGRPKLGIGQPIFRPTAIFPRHVWDDLPTTPEMASLGHDWSKEALSETMDCQKWEGRA